ncbi:hypothetical protein BJQ94_03880 [Cryobacterium sp. SO2]|uniref:hypothetical protein n=1 Tax=Cryobacterium sp. SO2 TaxID=1897060 RepID=UPI00223DC690|nr:hypothetical protein [Cryobacterium sp. SO2]WEO78187.1 hypothetical protein BJQ94_03880 [Cryobacterium sp. SO2]
MTSTEPGRAAGPVAGRDPALLVVLGLLVVLVVFALIVVFSRGQPAPLDAGTPSGVVQRYSTAVLAGDEDLAAGYLTESALAGCERTSPSTTDDIRVIFQGATERDSSADVRVSIVTSYGSGPFGVDEYQSDDVFDLEKVAGEWLIADAPWQLAVCPADQEDAP